MTEKTTKTSNSRPKYKAANPKQFAEMYTDKVPSYKELCDGESVTLDKNNKTVLAWLGNKIIIKEN